MAFLGTVSYPHALPRVTSTAQRRPLPPNVVALVVVENPLEDGSADCEPSASTPGQAAIWPQHGARLAAAAAVGLPLPQPPAAHSLVSGGGPGGHPPVSGGGGGGGGGGAGGRPWNLGEWLRLKKSPSEKKAHSAPIILTLASFAVTRKAYGRITGMFTREYMARTGQAVGFRLSFGGSGTQARAIIDGLPADIAALALPLDIMKISQAGLIAPDWQKRHPNNSVVATSVVAIVVRKDNPKHIQGWEDLIKDDVQVITANPKTAGVARWNFLALWGHKMAKGPKAAQDFTTRVFEHVPVQPRDAREASDVFYKQKTGDALLTYENEVIVTNESYGDKRLPYIVPQYNVQVETPIALIDRNINKKPPEARIAGEAFLDFLYTPAAQREFAACGFRSVLKEVREEFPLPPVKKTWRVERELGTWDKVQARFFDDQAVLDKIQRQIGEQRVQERRAAKRR